MPDKFTSWDDLESLPQAEFQCGSPRDAINMFSGKLYEEPLLIQSNARILIGHGTNGILRFAAFPSKVYPVPIDCRDFGFCQGMYHHTDNAVYLGNCHYSMVSDGRITDLSECSRPAETRYSLHFLPVTKIKVEKLNITISSCAPVADQGVKAFRGAPLPGPAGLLYSITIKNKSENIEKGLLRLNTSGILIGDYEDLNPETWKINKPDIYFRRDTLIISRPEGSAGVHLQGGKLTAHGDNYYLERSYEIPPGESRTYITFIVMGLKYNDIMEELYLLMRRDPFDWLALTVNFWRSRLPGIELSSNDQSDLTKRLHEFYIRCLFDNFNCLQTDKDGNLIAHRQGAPSHGFGTIWGIDYEPTIISAALICPELAEPALKFLLTRTRPDSLYCKKDHSVPILCSPVVIAAALLKQTGDLDIFSRIPELLNCLIGLMEEILTFKHPKETLFSTYWSSDGLTGRRYDYGTNVKLFYAFNGLAYILKALGKDGRKYEKIAGEIIVSIEKTMHIDGPFGLMLSGGTNLDINDEGLFIADNNIPYYDGEDTSTMLAPLYGACDENHIPWINYQRFGRSLFCENYQAEIDLRTWFATPPLSNDGTAILASLSGAVSRNEMADTGKTVVRFIDPVTGSLWWWPSGWKECRKLTRCSQGQGAWAWQYKNRWLGIETDALYHTLTIDPKGLPDKMHIYPSMAMGLPFEIDYNENRHECIVSNIDNNPWNVKVAFRKQGCGAEGERDIYCEVIQPNNTFIFKENITKTEKVKIDTFSKKDIVNKEVSVFGSSGILFSRRGALWYWFQGSRPPFDLRFVIGNGTGNDWMNAKVTLNLPAGCYASARDPGMLTENDYTAQKYSGMCTCSVGNIEKSERKTASFVFHMPLPRQIAHSGFNQLRHLLKDPFSNDALIASDEIKEPDTVELSAVLEATTTEGKSIKQILDFKAGYIPN